MEASAISNQSLQQEILKLMQNLDDKNKEVGELKQLNLEWEHKTKEILYEI